MYQNDLKIILLIFHTVYYRRRVFGEKERREMNGEGRREEKKNMCLHVSKCVVQFNNNQQTTNNKQRTQSN